MDQQRILKFLRQVMSNNNREWFQEHKRDYEIVRAEFERGVQQAIERIVRMTGIEENISAIKALCPPDVTYGEIRLVLAAKGKKL